MPFLAKLFSYFDCMLSIYFVERRLRQLTTMDLYSKKIRQRPQLSPYQVQVLILYFRQNNTFFVNLRENYQ